MSQPKNCDALANEARPSPRLAVESSTARTIVIDGRQYLFFGGCGYLALAHEPRVLAALSQGAARYGVSSGAARETTGNVCDHEALEREIAAALELEDALLLPEGATANLALGESLDSEFSSAIADAESHPTLLHAARTSGIPLSTYGDDDAALRAIAASTGDVVVWTDGVFPSAGRMAPLAKLLGALPLGRGLLVVDDCHGFGVLGKRGRGSVEAAGIFDARVVVTGTLSKALGTYGGFVAGTRERIANVRSRSAVYAGTTPLAPPLTSAARAALAILVGEPARLATYRSLVSAFRSRLALLRVPMKDMEFPVCAFELAPAARMRQVHEACLREGVFLPLIRYAGAGPDGFFRIVWNAAHTPADLERLVVVLGRALESA